MDFKFLFLSFLSLLPSIFFAQKEDNYPFIEDFNTSIGIQTSLDYYNYEFSDANSENLINYSAGFSVKRRISGYLEVRSGLLYSEKGFVRYQPITPGLPEFGTIQFNIHAGYLDIPLQIGYRYALNRKFTIVPSGGFIVGFLVKKSISSDYGEEALFFDALTKGLNSPAYGINLSLDLEFHITDRWFVQYGAYFRQGLNKVHETFLVSNPTSFGVAAGFYRKF